MRTKIIEKNIGFCTCSFEMSVYPKPIHLKSDESGITIFFHEYHKNEFVDVCEREFVVLHSDEESNYGNLNYIGTIFMRNKDYHVFENIDMVINFHSEKGHEYLRNKI